MEMVHVVRCAIAGKTEDDEAAAAGLGELLHAAGAPAEDGAARKMELAEEPGG